MHRDGAEASLTTADGWHQKTVEPPLGIEDGIWLKKEIGETSTALHQEDYRG